LQVLGKPSAELAAKMSSEEKERVCKQQECLGEEGLKERGQELDKAIAQNEVHSL
jgi:Zn-dependent M16 (insulinase) family peptidase